MGRRSKQILLERRHTDGQKTRENMLNIDNYERNANQNYNKVSPHTSQNGHHQNNLQIINAGQHVVKGKSSDSWWECKFVQPLWSIVWNLL